VKKIVYKKKVFILSGVIAALAIIYILAVFFDPGRVGSRSEMYSWLEGGQSGKVNGIAIANEYETINLSHNGGKWFVSRDGGREYPARHFRVEDFLLALTTRASYPVRSNSGSSHERLSLTEGMAERVTVSGAAALPLLDLLIGHADATGRNVYLRKQGQNEVRSGEDIFTSYTRAPITSWYNLRLFPENEEGKLDAANVQRLAVYPYAPAGGEALSGGLPLIFTRSGREWAFNFALANPGPGKVDSYIRDILGVSASDFAENMNPSDPLLNDSRIVMELGDGSIRTVRLSRPEEDGRRYAVVSGADWVYSLPGWAADRLFASTERFEAD
jgi:hypothetical protein